MAPRRLDLLDLPDNAIVHIFGNLLPAERHRLLPFVCRRFGDLCYSPQLLPTAFDLDLELLGQLSRVRSFAEWLVRRGAGRVQRLRLRLSLNLRNETENDGLEDLVTTEDDDQAGAGLEMLSEMLTAISFCAARGSLQELNLDLEMMPRFRLSAAVVAALSTLRSP